MKKSILSGLAIAVVLLPAFILADEKRHDHEMERPRHGRENHMHSMPANENPLVHEMMILDGVFREVVSGVAMADGGRVHDALENMHGTMEKTHEAVHEGRVKIPRNADRLEEFVKMDREFHENLDGLAAAAHKNDSEKMLSLAKVLLDGCVSCHAQYR